MRRILITGSNGLLGQKLVEIFSRGNYPLQLLSQEDHSVFNEEAVSYRRIDTTNRQDVRRIIEEFEPEFILHTAAITNVDLCETERKLAWQVNVGSVENIAHAAKLVGAHVVHLSTDYVFDGKNGPYAETDRPNPLSYYGRTKLASENLLRTSGIPSTIIRTMVLYGTGYNVKPNFALWLLQSLREGKQVKVVDDQIGNPTLVDDVAYGILRIVDLGRTGLYNIAGADLVSRLDFALALAKVFGFNRELILPAKTQTMKQPAPRPLKSGFITLKAQTELNLKASGMLEGLAIFKTQVTNMESRIRQQHA